MGRQIVMWLGPVTCKGGKSLVGQTIGEKLENGAMVNGK